MLAHGISIQLIGMQHSLSQVEAVQVLRSRQFRYMSASVTCSWADSTCFDTSGHLLPNIQKLRRTGQYRISSAEPMPPAAPEELPEELLEELPEEELLLLPPLL